MTRKRLWRVQAAHAVWETSYSEAMDTDAVEKLVSGIQGVLDGQPVSEGLAALLTMTYYLLDDILKQNPPGPVAAEFRKLQDGIGAWLRAAFPRTEQAPDAAAGAPREISPAP